MPPRPRAPRTRVSGIRRPRVAGTTPGSPGSAHNPSLVAEPNGSRYGAVALDDAIRPAPDDLAAPDLAAPDLAAPDPAVDPAVEAETVVLTKPARRRARYEPSAVVPEPLEEAPADTARPGMLQRRLAVPLLAVALIVLTGLAVFFALADARLNGSPAASNTALVDMAATTAATGQLTAALKVAYSYDYARLDENERDSRAGMTPSMADQFSKLFAQVRQYAPEQKAVVTATIVVSGVQSIEGDRAVLIAFMDQQATRTGADGKPSQFFAPGRLTVVGKKIDGHWKIDSMEAR